MKKTDMVDVLMQAQSKRRLFLSERRSLVAAYMLTGLYTCDTLTEKMTEEGYEVTLGMVKQDFKLMQDRWVESASKDVAQWIERELAKLDELEDEAVKLKEAGFATTYIDVVLRILKRRSELLGLDQPAKVAVYAKVHNIHDAQSLTIEQLEAVIRKGLREKEEQKLLPVTLAAERVQ